MPSTVGVSLLRRLANGELGVLEPWLPGGGACMARWGGGGNDSDFYWCFTFITF